MPRWYSKQRKARYSYEMRAYGCIPSFAKIVLGQRNPFNGLEKCSFGDDCEFCTKPSKGTFVSMSYYPEAEANYYICGRCVLRGYYKDAVGNDRMYSGYTKFARWKRRQVLKPGQHICNWCDQTVEGDCDCNGARYHQEHQQTAFRKKVN